MPTLGRGGCGLSSKVLTFHDVALSHTTVLGRLSVRLGRSSECLGGFDKCRNWGEALKRLRENKKALDSEAMTTGLHQRVCGLKQTAMHTG